jgi:hypothetical protein
MAKGLRMLFMLFMLFMLMMMAFLWTGLHDREALAASTGKIGVVFSKASEDYSVISRPEGVYNNQKVDKKETWSPALEKEEKLYALLQEKGFQVEKVTDQDLRNASVLRQYEALVFAHTVLMSKEQRASVKEYIRSGGGALFIYGTARNEATKVPKEGQLDFTPLIYDTKTWIWEWDNLTEVFQSGFVNDVLVENTTLTQASSHPIIQNTLKALGQSKLSIRNNRGGGDWIEVLRPYKGAKVTPLLTYENIGFSKKPEHASKGTNASYAIEYGKGRVVWFGFRAFDYVGIPYPLTYKNEMYDGLQGEEEMETLFEQSLLWTTAPHSANHPINRRVAISLSDVKAYARPNEYAVYGTATVQNTGNVPSRGTLLVEVIAPNGKTLESYKKHLVGLTPDASSYSNYPEKFHLSLPKNPANGRYELKVTYRFGREGQEVLQTDAAKLYLNIQGNQTKSIVSAGTFKDVPWTHWAAKDIYNLSYLGIITGYPDGTFRPNNKITRLQGAQMLVRALNAPLSSSTKLNASDLKPGAYGYEAAAYAVNKGILDLKNGQFRPNDYLNRGDMAKALVTAFHLKGYTQDEFRDMSAQSSVREFINVLAANNVTTGYPDGTFRPNEFVTRVQFSAFVDRSLHVME